MCRKRSLLNVLSDDVEDCGLYPDGSVVAGYRAWATTFVPDTCLPDLPALGATEGGNLLVGGGDPTGGNVGMVGCPLSIVGIVVWAVFVLAGRAMATRTVLAGAHGQYGWY
jgi:hypothetical protein